MNRAQNYQNTAVWRRLTSCFLFHAWLLPAGRANLAALTVCLRSFRVVVEYLFSSLSSIYAVDTQSDESDDHTQKERPLNLPRRFESPIDNPLNYTKIDNPLNYFPTYGYDLTIYHHGRLLLVYDAIDVIIGRRQYSRLFNGCGWEWASSDSERRRCVYHSTQFIHEATRGSHKYCDDFF